MKRLRPTPILLLALVGAAPLGTPSVAGAATIEVTNAALRVDVPAITGTTTTRRTGAMATPLAGGGALVGVFGFYNPAILSVGQGCSQVELTNLGRPPTFQDANPALAATCNLTGAVGIRGKLLARDDPQVWFSTLAMPTRISAESKGSASTTPVNAPGDVIATGPAGDIINAGNGPDDIDAGDAPFKGQEFFPGTTGEFEDSHTNAVNAGAGNDTIRLNAGTGEDIVSGGIGIDGVTYADRFPSIGLAGQAGVNVSLNDVDDDGDPSIDPPSAAIGEDDNVKSDVEKVIGTRREDILIGNASANVLEGGEGKDTLTGLAGADTIRARETPSASVGTKDTISCGTPRPFLPPQTFLGTSIGGTGSVDSLDFDLADVAPSDCEILTQGAVKEGPNVVVAATVRRAARGRLRVRLSCPRAAGRTCAGALRIAARTGRGGPKAAFSIRRGRAKAVTVSLPGGSALAARRTTVRLVAVERGRHGKITTVAYARVRA